MIFVHGDGDELSFANAEDINGFAEGVMSSLGHENTTVFMT
jgi:hypothetical protein